MPTYYIQRDRETSASAGAMGMYQIISIEDENHNDLTSEVDQGIHFSLENNNKLVNYLSNLFDENKNDIDIEFV